MDTTDMPLAFSAFAQDLSPLPVLRARIAAATRMPEPACVQALLAEATLPPEAARRTRETAARLVAGLRAKGDRGPVGRLVQDYALSGHEGTALMCLAEALLRIPDRATRDALIRDKISHGNWQAPPGHRRSPLAMAAACGLRAIGGLADARSDQRLATALARVGMPAARAGLDMAMHLLGRQFVTGRTIAAALANARRMEARGFRHSYDMLGEAAMSAADAGRYFGGYEQAIHAVGAASGRRGVVAGPGVSVKLSALHPRFARAQRGRVMAELLPRLQHLCALARAADIGLTIDAEEAQLLDLSLDLLEALARDPGLAGWNGLGVAVQAYQKRAPPVVDWLVDLARNAGRRLMVRLVKGAYWDAEIKRAQVDGLDGFPVFTRKLHTDVCYLACARRLLAAPDAVFPQFATHNAQTLASILTLAGTAFTPERYEFQCLQGMGEPLYENVVGPGGLDRPCRIYAPVGTHATLLAYLVRRLLENGANASFVHRVGDPSVPVDDLTADPAALVAAAGAPGAPHPRIALPRDLYGPERPNSAGFDLADERQLAAVAPALAASAATAWQAAPMLGDGDVAGERRPVRNPADRRDVVGHVADSVPAVVERALAIAARSSWQDVVTTERAAILRRAADLLEARLPAQLGLIVREAGRTLPNAVGEVREAVDFLRYYAAQAAGFDNATHRPLGPVACISPWNFPLAIFMGQVAAALVCGNTVLAKPAEQTPLIAAQAVALLREAGVPAAAVQLLPGDGAVGARLAGDPRVRGVMFTGSTEVAKLIQRQLAERLNPDGSPVPLIAETGGQNAMVVDSSALPEQVVADALASAFDSAGQRCSALRLLCLQDEVADRIMVMLKGAMAELSVGNPDRLATDIGPVITAAARDDIAAHIRSLAAGGRAVHAASLPPLCRHGSFVAPTLIEIASLDDLTREVFGPVLHVLRWRREDLDALIDGINAMGYALTFGVHTRLDATIAGITGRVAAGNCYVNRTMIGATVGVQPFGGHGLSGTGPKAGGPLTLLRLLAASPAPALPGGAPDAVAHAWCDWLATHGMAAEAAQCAALAETSPLGMVRDLAGPVGERNTWSLEPRGDVLCRPVTAAGLAAQVTAALATGNRALVTAPPALRWLLAGLHGKLSARVLAADAGAPAAAALIEGDAVERLALQRALAARPGPIVPMHLGAPLEWLVRERAVCVNTAAAGGNASLMAIG